MQYFRKVMFVTLLGPMRIVAKLICENDDKSNLYQLHYFGFKWKSHSVPAFHLIVVWKIGFMWQVWNFVHKLWWAATVSVLVCLRAVGLGCGKGGPDSSFPLEPVVCSDPVIRYHHCLRESWVPEPTQPKEKCEKAKFILTRSIKQDGVDLWISFLRSWFSLIFLNSFTNH